MSARRYRLVIRDRFSGVERGFGINLRLFLVLVPTVVILPILIGLGAKWSAAGELGQLRAANSALLMENTNYRALPSSSALVFHANSARLRALTPRDPPHARWRAAGNRISLKTSRPGQFMQATPTRSIQTRAATTGRGRWFLH